LAGERHAEDGQALEHARWLPVEHLIRPVVGSDVGLGLQHDLQYEADVEANGGGAHGGQTVHVPEHAERHYADHRDHDHDLED